MVMIGARAAGSILGALLLAAAGSATAQNLGDTPRPERIVSPCLAKAPPTGQTFHGAVLQVIDGRTLCVAQGPGPDSWIPVSVSEIPDASSRGALMAAAFAKPVTCVAGPVTPEGATARCIVGGRDLAALVGKAAIIKASFEWR